MVVVFLLAVRHQIVRGDILFLVIVLVLILGLLASCKDFAVLGCTALVGASSVSSELRL